MIAAAAFLLSIGSPVAAKAVQADTIWVYQDGSSHSTPMPDCKAKPQSTCALEFYLDGSGEPDLTNPTGRVIPGERR